MYHKIYEYDHIVLLHNIETKNKNILIKIYVCALYSNKNIIVIYVCVLYSNENITIIYVCVLNSNENITTIYVSELYSNENITVIYVCVLYSNVILNVSRTPYRYIKCFSFIMIITFQTPLFVIIMN